MKKRCRRTMSRQILAIAVACCFVKTSNGQQRANLRGTTRTATTTFDPDRQALQGLKIIVQTRDRDEYKGWHKFSLEVSEEDSKNEHFVQGSAPTYSEFKLHTLCRRKRRLETGHRRLADFHVPSYLAPMGLESLVRFLYTASQPMKHPLLSSPCEVGSPHSSSDDMHS